MILFFDTSALVKLYADEAHSDWMRCRTDEAPACLVSQITWVEMCAALAFKRRTGQIDADALGFAMGRLRAEWPGYVRLAVDAELIADAGRLAQNHALRAYDSLQLATACKAREVAGSDMGFCVFDRALAKAAADRGMRVVAPPPN